VVPGDVVAVSPCSPHGGPLRGLLWPGSVSLLALMEWWQILGAVRTGGTLTTPSYGERGRIPLDLHLLLEHRSMYFCVELTNPGPADLIHRGDAPFLPSGLLREAASIELRWRGPLWFLVRLNRPGTDFGKLSVLVCSF
jgi:hypothetical protein